MALRLSTLFFKSAGCPSSERLLKFQNRALLPKQMRQTKSHLAYCEFCSAELQLLMRYQTGEEESSLAEMPLQLRRLAERLLKSRIAYSPQPRSLDPLSGRR